VRTDEKIAGAMSHLCKDTKCEKWLSMKYIEHGAVIAAFSELKLLLLLLLIIPWRCCAQELRLRLRRLSLILEGGYGSKQPWDGSLAFCFLLICLLQGILFFFGVKSVILTGERLHRYKQIAHVCFELAPLEARVEQFQDEGFDLNLVQVGEHLAQQRLNQLHGEVFVGGEGVSLFVRIEDWLFDEALRSVH